MKIKITKEQLNKHLETQMKFLNNSFKTYDEGLEEEAQRIATVIRVLVHDTNSSKSLMQQLGIKNQIYYISSVGPYIPANAVSYTGLFGMRTTGQYIPLCLMSDDMPNKWYGFEDWWNEIVIDDKHFIFSRKDIVQFVANQIGGAHVDDSIEPKYANLHYNNSIGWIFSDGASEYQFSNSAAYASIRQIAEEVVTSISFNNMIKSYTRKKAEEHQACCIDSRKYYLNEMFINDPIASKLCTDDRITKREPRTLFLDDLILHNMEKTQRHVIR